MADEVESGSKSGDEPETSELEECESHCSTSSERSCASDGDGGQDVVEWYLDRVIDA